MKMPFLAVTMLALSSAAALAADDNSISGKEMHDLAAKHSGATANPTAKPDSGSLSEKAMNDQPGVNSDTTGKTGDPTSKPADGSLAGKAMRDNPAVGK
jgi:hypothetical protein